VACRTPSVVRATVLTVALALLAAFSVAAGSPVMAGSASLYQPKNVSVPYDQNWTFISHPLKACMFVDVSGTLKAHHRNAYAFGSVPDPKVFLWSNLRMEKPKITMITGTLAKTLAGTQCNLSEPTRFEKVTLQQQWYEGGCHMSVSISAGAPWSIAVTPTYSCGSHRVADRTTTYGAGHSFAQHNSGYPVYYSGTLLGQHNDVIPVRGNVTVTGYRKIDGKQVSDTFDTKGALAFMDDCGGKCLSES
jgi:hypothetical protein